MRAILHIGAHKTGSTSIQRALLESTELLADRSIYLPGSPPGFTYPNHSILAQRLASGDREAARTWLADAFAAARRRGAETVILTGEDLCVLQGAEIRWLVNEVRDYAWDAQAFLYLRNKADYLLAQYRHALVHWDAQLFVEVFVREMKFSPRDSIVLWRGQLGDRFHAHRLEEVGDPVEHFFSEALGVDSIVAARENVGAPLDVAFLANALGKSFGPPRWRDHLFESLRDVGSPARLSFEGRVASELSQMYDDAEWIVELEPGRRVALIDDRQREVPVDMVQRLRHVADLYAELARRLEADGSDVGEVPSAG